MSDTEETLAAEGEAASEQPAPKKKVARKRAARKSAKKPDATSAANDSDASQDIPDSFSASPDDVDDYGDVGSRQSRDAEASNSDTDDAKAAGRDQASKASDGPSEGASQGNSSDSRDSDEHSAEDDNRNSQRGRQNRHQGRQQGGNPNGGKGGKFNKNKKFNKGQHPNQHGGKGGKPGHRSRGKRPQWQNDFMAASEEDIEPPTFESLSEWEPLVSESSMETYLAEQLDDDAEPLDYNAIYGLTLGELIERAQADEIKWDGSPGRQKILEAYLKQALETKRPVKATGVVEVIEDGFGFLLFPVDNYRLKTFSPWIAPTFVTRNGLQRGHQVDVLLHAPRESDTCPAILRIDSVMGRSADEIQSLTPFKELVPYYPTERIVLESDHGLLGKWDNISMRVVDLLSPVGLGQRGLIVAPPRTGKTVLLQGIANAIRVNKPKARLIILLVDERPEEVTDFRRSVEGAEVISSTFDESAESHVHAAEIVIENARRLVEIGEDVIILLDSITRLARAYNTMMPNSGKILSGGVEAGALQKPKRFFGSARNIEGGGSLTILGTALVETGSKMDEVIFEEFKGTGNMELHLDRELSNKRIFPSLSFEKSGTRKEEILYHPDEMDKVYALRRAMKGVPSTEAMEMLIKRIRKTDTNAIFLMGLQR